MDVWHRIGRVVRISNLGTLIFFVLNIGLLLIIFFPEGFNRDDVISLIACYFVTVFISLSPIGEWGLSIMIGAKNIKRNDTKIRLIPLLEVVYDKAKGHTPSMVDSINLKIIYDDAPNAFAIGRKTICVTSGLLALSDDDIMGVLAHELGHIAYQHTVIQLLIGGGNLFISGFLMIVKLSCWLITVIFSLFAIGSRNLWAGIIITFFGSISTIFIWLWTKFCMLFLMWSMRQNEFVADRFAYEIGFGMELARVLDTRLCSSPNGGILKAIYSTHPDTDDRIARLQQLGTHYYAY